MEVVNKEAALKFHNLLQNVYNIGWDTSPQGWDYWNKVSDNLILVTGVRSTQGMSREK